MLHLLLLSLSMTVAAPVADHFAHHLVTGHYQRWLIADAHGYIFDIQNASTENGALLGLWTYWGGANQQWQLRAGTDGSYSLINGNGKLVTVENSSDALGAVINQWDDANQTNQHFNIAPVSDQHYTIVNVNSSLCLTAQGGGGAGTTVVQGACDNPASIWQFFAIDDSGAIAAP